MTELIADLLEGESLCQQVSRTGVTQSVRPARDTVGADGAKPPSDDCRDARGRERTPRCLDGQKHFPAAATGSRMLQVAQQRIAYRTDC
jgi:hypothetical protein